MMDEQEKCLDDVVLSRLAEGALDESSGEGSESLHHLDRCAACRARLDELVGTGPEAEFEGSDSIGEGSRTLGDLMDHLKRNPTSSGSRVSEADLTFLLPSNQPGVIGTIGSYEVLGVVAQGGMGVVLEARDPKLDRSVAIKVMSPALTVPGAKEKFLREARAAASLDHPNVLPVFAVDEQNGVPYLVMPLVAGETLQQRVDREGPLPLSALVDIGSKVARALAAAHEAGIVHRDVKPGNILLDAEDGRVWIADFGLARAGQDSSRSVTGTIAGTPQFMAPEQFETTEVDPRADLFSLGGVLHTMATGEPPFDGASAVTAMRSVQQDRPRRISELPDWFADLIQKLLEKSPASRPGSAKIVAETIESKGSVPLQLQKRWSPWVVVSGIAAVVAAVFFLGKGERHTTAQFRVDGKGYSTLESAIANAPDGATIEIAGGGDVRIHERITIDDKFVHLRAGSGVRPILYASGGLSAIKTRAPLLLEGIEIKQIETLEPGEPVILANDALFLRNCRVSSTFPFQAAMREQGDPTRRMALVKLSGSGSVHASNTGFFSSGTSLFQVEELGSDSGIALENCAGTGLDLLRVKTSKGDLSLDLERCSFAVRTAILLRADSDIHRLAVSAKHSVLSCQKRVIASAGYTPRELRDHVGWDGDGNVYAIVAPAFIAWSRTVGINVRRMVFDLEDWLDFWGRKETNAVIIRERVKNWISQAQWPTSIEEINPSHLLLPERGGQDDIFKKLSEREIAPGIEAGKVGPGEAFEALRQLPEHGSWIDEARSTCLRMRQ